MVDEERMNDFVSRETLIECLGDRPENWMDKPEEIQAVADWDAFSGIVRRLPTADVRQVVYCRDCMYAPAGDDDGNCLEWPCDDWPDRNPCPLKCGDNWYSKKPEPDFFCKNGKRKRNG
jgi:hypothetical protein